MALTQEQWYQKIKKFVPSWWFERESLSGGALSPALFRAMAALFQQIQQDTDDAQAATFITGATSPILDLLGDERSRARLSLELDPAYRTRIQRITSQTDLDDIQTAVDALLLIPPCTIQEAPLTSLYCSRSTFCSRDQFFLNYLRNAFLIVVPRQTHAPYSFTSRSMFCSRSSFAGSNVTSNSIYSSIIATVDAMKADGVLYGIVESQH